MKPTLEMRTPITLIRATTLFVAAAVLLMTTTTVEGQDPAIALHLQEQAESQLELTGSFHLEQDANHGYLVLEASVPKGSYIYSLTQEGNPPPSRIEVAKAESYQVSGAFKPDSEPVVVENDPTFKNRTEKHKQNVRFFIPLQIATETNPAELTIPMRFNGQICSETEGTCTPIQDRVINANFGGFYQRVAEQTKTGTINR